MRLLALALSAVTARAACRNVTIDFLLLETNSMTAAIKDDIRSDLAVIGIDAMMLARLTRCVLSMLSACRCAYAHMTITYHALVLPPGCSLLPAHTGSSSSSILRAACASASFSSL